MIELPINPKTGRRMLVLRQSDFKQWLTDRRDFYFSVFENLEPVYPKTSVADIGTFVHEAMKAHYLGQTDPTAAIAKLASEQCAAFPLNASELQGHADFARIIMEGYLEWLEEEALDHGLKPLMVEDRITALVGVFQDIEVYVSGAIDLLMQDDFDLIWIFDHKTVDGFKTILATLPVDFQGQTYDFLLRSIGITPMGFKHNQLRRVKRTARSTPPYYNRAEVLFNATQRQTHEWHMQGIAKEIVDAYVTMSTESPEHKASTFHRLFYPFFTRDSSWKSNFLDVSIFTDTDPEAANDMLAAAYKQKESVV